MCECDHMIFKTKNLQGSYYQTTVLINALFQKKLQAHCTLTHRSGMTEFEKMEKEWLSMMYALLY